MGYVASSYVNTATGIFRYSRVGVTASPSRGGRVSSNPGSLPAFLLRNSFEGGIPLGATVSTVNSGGGSGNAFDSVTTSTTHATVTFDSAESDAAGLLSGKIATDATSGNAYVTWQTSLGLQTQVWFRVYCYFTAFPAGNLRLIRLESSATTQCALIEITTAGQVRTLNAASTTLTTSTATIPLNRWFRLEGYCIGSPNLGQVQVKLFSTSPYGPVSGADETDTSAAANTLSSIGKIDFGNPNSSASTTFWIDDLGVSNTGYIGPATPRPVPLPGPVRVRIAHPTAPFISGRIASNRGAPIQNPTPGPVFRQAVHPAQPRIPQNAPRGRILGISPGAPVQDPTPGPVFYPAVQALRARLPQQPLLRGRISSGSGAPVRNPTPGPVFYPAVHPIRVPVPQVFSKGRSSGNPGAPVHDPTPGPVFRQATSPCRSALPPPHPRAGRICSSPGAPVSNPNPGPPVYPLQGPVRVRVPQLHPRAGRMLSNAGAPVRNPTPGPVFRQKTYPCRSVLPPLHPRAGRTGSNQGAAVQDPTSGPPVYPLQGPIRGRVPQLHPRCGYANSSQGAPVRNPVPGPQVYPLHGPIGNAARAPGPFRKGGVLSNPGGPVTFPRLLRFRTGSPCLQWTAGIPVFQWAAGTPSLQWATGTPEIST